MNDLVNPQNPYFNEKRARNILFAVLLIHVGAIAVPLIYASLTDYFDPPEIVMRVGISDQLPPGDSPNAPDLPSTRDDNPGAETNVDDLPPMDIPDPADVSPLPDLRPPDPLPPAVVTPQPPIVQPDPPPVTAVPQTPKTTPTKPTYLSAEQIKKTTPAKTQAQIDAERRAREKAAADQRARERAAREAAEARNRLISSIRGAASHGSSSQTYGSPDSGQQGILATKEMRDYYNELNTFIRPQWNAVSPSSVELNGQVKAWPVVALTLAKNGRVTSAVVEKNSGNAAVDAAVKALLANMKVVPAPPQACVIRVTLDIR